MFSTIIEKILLEILGEYIDGIKNSMDVALLKGKITIENVSLKRDFFNNLSLPLRLGFSLVEAINIHIPWSSLKDKPTTVEINGIYALFYVNYEMEEYRFDPEKRLNEMIDKATELIKMKLEEK